MLNKLQIGIIIQARMNSTRLPGKILLPFANDKTMLGYLLERLKNCKTIDKLIVATTCNSKDNKLVKWLENNKYDYFRGSEENCIERYYKTVNEFELDVIIRITSDCPLVPPELVDEMVSFFIKHIDTIDYLSNREYTNFPEGVDIEIFKKNMLHDAYFNGKKPEEKEHINYFFLNKKNNYKIHYYNHNNNCTDDISDYKLSVDTMDDYYRIRYLYEKNSLNEQFTFNQLMTILQKDKLQAIKNEN